MWSKYPAIQTCAAPYNAASEQVNAVVREQTEAATVIAPSLLSTRPPPLWRGFHKLIKGWLLNQLVWGRIRVGETRLPGGSSLFICICLAGIPRAESHIIAPSSKRGVSGFSQGQASNLSRSGARDLGFWPSSLGSQLDELPAQGG